jgi:hypothetical protein
MPSLSLRTLLRRLTKAIGARFRPARRYSLRLESLENRMAPAIFTVTNTQDSGMGSLRQAILDANADPFVDTIAFSIDGGAQTIRPASQLPALTKPVVVDGTTQPGYAGTPLIVLDGGSAGTSANGLTLTGGNSAVEGLVVNNFGGSGIVLSEFGGDSILGDYLGTNVAGTVAAGNNIGLEIDSTNNVVGSTISAARNLISGNQVGIQINSANNIVLGNYIGTDATGTHALGDGVGMGIAGNNNQIGGTQTGARNLISGCATAGVSIGANGNIVQGNYIGTDATGASALGNGTGVLLNTSQVNLIGGTAPGAGNVISGNGDGIAFINSVSNTIQGNFIGTNAIGTTAVGNLRGVLDRAGSNTIGGTASGAGNVISGNRGNGLELDGTSSVVLGNKIGTDITGTTAMPNTGDGVAIGNSFNVIGSVAAGAGNLISGNQGNGVDILAGVSNVIQANRIGTDVTGTLALGNQLNGVTISASVNTVGGTTAAARNLISGNTGTGIRISGTGNVVLGNYIGTDASGALALANGDSGVKVLSSNNTIGGTTAGARNVISGNLGDGVMFLTGSGNVVEGNYIGTDVTATQALGNGVGVSVGPFNDNDVIGGTTAAARNLISGNASQGVLVTGSAANIVVEGNYIGTNVSGTQALGNGTGITIGIALSDSVSCLVGGTDAGAGNLISGNLGDGLDTFGFCSVTVQGNYIGTDVTGTQALGNQAGISVTLSIATIGGTAAGARNLISGNRGDGIHFESAEGTVQGNYIGTDVTGTHALGNQAGFSANVADATTIGGAAAGAGNLISGNRGDGLVLIDFEFGSAVLGNYIGTDSTGTRALGNQNGIVERDQGFFTIGGTAAGAGNLISGNRGNGVELNGGGTVVLGNKIGTDFTGTTALANNGDGIAMASIETTIGGVAAGAGNLISGNQGNGVEISGIGSSVGTNVIQGNRIGTDVTGTRALGNHLNGVSISETIFISFNTIGGPAAGAGNLISGNARAGIYITQIASRNVVQGNFIGTDLTGTQPLGNGTGVEIVNASSNTIGGTAPGALNVISGNHGAGVQISSNGDFVQGNFIGTNVSGTLPLGNQTGVTVSGANNTIGGTSAGAGNTISGNRNDGVVLTGDGNLVLGNFIGTNAPGSAALANDDGVTVSGGSNNVIGGTAPGARNVLSGNRFDGALIGGGQGNLVQGNFVGTDATGTSAVPNRTGVILNGAGTVGGTVAGAGNTISGNTEIGLLMTGAGGLAEGNFVGTDASGTSAISNGTGVYVNGAATVGGTASGAGNLISGNSINGIGVWAAGTGSLIEGNLIGTDATGRRALPNSVGVFVSGPANTVGGAASGAGNVISGNTFQGIWINQSGARNVVQGNLIGTDATGTVALPNHSDGIFVDHVSGNTIGGTAAGAGNVISGNTGSGVEIDLSGGLTGNVVQGNYLGTDITGTSPLGNGRYGIQVQEAQGTSTLIGGPEPGAGNVISANTLDGARIITGNGSAVVQGNRIGTNVSGTQALGNGGDGIVAGPNVTIGGAAPGAGNVISGNGGAGISLSNGDVEGNRIGTDISGTQALGNGGDGVAAGSNTTIGGTAAGAGNVISANAGAAISLIGNGNLVQGNQIGTDLSGTQPLGNRGSGVVVGGSNNTVGGTTPGAGNVIAFNGGDGVLIDAGTGNAILHNRIFANANLGIELLHGGNNNQAAPVLTSAVSGDGITNIQGTFTGRPSTTYTLEFFADTDDPAQGRQFLGSFTITTDANGVANFTISLGLELMPGEWITATSTDPNNNTSAFSHGVAVSGG